jgi:hypothetical protein
VNETVTVDHVLKVGVDAVSAVNELTTLDCLAAGLNVLASRVHSMERPVQQYEEANRTRVDFTGFNFLSKEDEQLIPCFTHWFANSICNYARLAGFLVGLGQGAFDWSAIQDQKKAQEIKTHCTDYVKSIVELQPVVLWRNKVSAHFALTDPRLDDNAALLATSTISPISYSDHRLRSSSGMIHTVHGAEASLPGWSVTEIYEALAARWPLGPIGRPETNETIFDSERPGSWS